MRQASGIVDCLLSAKRIIRPGRGLPIEHNPFNVIPVFVGLFRLGAECTTRDRWAVVDATVQIHVGYLAQQMIISRSPGSVFTKDIIFLDTGILLARQVTRFALWTFAIVIQPLSAFQGIFGVFRIEFGHHLGHDAIQFSGGSRNTPHC